MELFPNEVDPLHNLLPRDGAVYHHGSLYDAETSDKLMELLLSGIDWKADEAVWFDQSIQTKRKVAWYGDQSYAYTYSNATKRSLPWTPLLLKIKKEVEARTRQSYNSCLLNLYHTGLEGMAWHSDSEKQLKKNGAIASLSFGATRVFAFKHKRSGQKIKFHLTAGSLLVMCGETQTHWLHRLPPTKTVLKPRINLTFRTIVSKNG